MKYSQIAVFIFVCSFYNVCNCQLRPSCRVNVYRPNGKLDGTKYGYCWYLDEQELPPEEALKVCISFLGVPPSVPTRAKARKLARYIKDAEEFYKAEFKHVLVSRIDNDIWTSTRTKVNYDRKLTHAWPGSVHQDYEECVYFLAETKKFTIQKCMSAPFICEEYVHLHPSYPNEGPKSLRLVYNSPVGYIEQCGPVYTYAYQPIMSNDRGYCWWVNTAKKDYNAARVYCMTQRAGYMPSVNNMKKAKVLADYLTDFASVTLWSGNEVMISSIENGTWTETGEKVLFNRTLTPETQVLEAEQGVVFNYRFKQWSYSNWLDTTSICEEKHSEKLVIKPTQAPEQEKNKGGSDDGEHVLGCPDKFRLVDNMCFLVIQEILKIGKLTEKCQVLGGAHLAEFNTKEQFHSMKKFIEGEKKKTGLGISLDIIVRKQDRLLWYHSQQDARPVLRSVGFDSSKLVKYYSQIYIDANGQLKACIKGARCKLKGLCMVPPHYENMEDTEKEEKKDEEKKEENEYINVEDHNS